MTFAIGPYQFSNNLVLAPMAGVTDRPFRQMCRRLGAGVTVGEMTSSRPDLRHTRKSRLRRDHAGEPAPIIVQIAGTEPDMMAAAARFNVDQGAQIIDINMGCPAKKVCRKEAGSALMRDPDLVTRILERVANAVNVPVTLKIRTGWSEQNRNALQIGQIAQQCGIAAVTVHGRTRDQKYSGLAEYETIRLLKQELSIPVIANGDIDSEKKARMVMDITKADAIMIGRAAQSRPWIFRHIRHFLVHGQCRPEPDPITRKTWLLQHLENLYQFYGEFQGVRIARKHINWQLGDHKAYVDYKPGLMNAESASRQIALIERFFNQLDYGHLARSA